jgi:hypothetical protein
MTKEMAVAAAKAYNDIEDFHMFMDDIRVAYARNEGDFREFYKTQLEPLLEAELKRRETVLESL